MATFEVIAKTGNHEQVVFCHDPDVGLKAIIALHNTTLGPALGGTRMWNYANEDEALTDVLRLSKGMTYKAAAAGLNLGGGKAVIIGDSKTQKTEGLFRAFGQFVNSLNGKYITAEDVGTSEQDMEYIYMETPWVTGISKDFGGSGDPSPYTAHGVLMGIKASVHEKSGSDSLKGLRIAVQGLGNVGFNLVKYLDQEGAKIIVSDIDPEKIKKIKDMYPTSEAVAPTEILSVQCDVLAPCAMGAIVNEKTIASFRTPIICGGANNQLLELRHGNALEEMGILYAPDYIVNAGGLMNVFVELEGYSQSRAFDKTKRVYDNLKQVYKIAKRDKIPTYLAADRLAEERIKMVTKLKQKHPGKSNRAFTTLREINNR